MTIHSTSTAPDPARRYLLDVRQLRTYFRTRDEQTVRAVDGVSLQVAAGEIVALVGESGSGKTVTGMTVMRLLDPRAVRKTSGSVELRQRDGSITNVLALSEPKMRRVRGSEIAMIFQDPLTSLNPVFTIGDQITEGIIFHSGADRRTARLRAAELLRQVGLGDAERVLGQYPHQLSGGMRQRAMIAIALSSDPLLLIADEPTTALDMTVQAQIVALLQKITRERGMGMIFVTHDLALVSKIADRVCVMYAGEIVEQGAAEAVFEAPLHPYTAALVGCVPRGQSVRLTPIPGHAPDLSRDLNGCRFASRCRHAQDACASVTIELRTIEPGRDVRCVRVEELQ